MFFQISIQELLKLVEYLLITALTTAFIQILPQIIRCLVKKSFLIRQLLLQNMQNSTDFEI
jgi:uncharacterized membrane protein